MGQQGINGRVALEAVGAGTLAATGLVVGGFIITGMVQTKAYVPDIIQAYESVDYLQQKVSFGRAGSPWPVVGAGLIMTAVIGIVYYRVRMKYKRRASPPS